MKLLDKNNSTKHNKKILVALVVAILSSPFVVALFVPREYKWEKDVIVNKPREYVFDYLKYLKHEERYSVVSKVDSTLKISHLGDDGNVGFVSRLSGNKTIGEIELEIKELIQNEKVSIDVRFLYPRKKTTNLCFITEDLRNGSTKVKFTYSGSIKYPMNILRLFSSEFIDNPLENKIIALNLNNLKNILEGYYYAEDGYYENGEYYEYDKKQLDKK